jgi:hypothetical protein
LGSGFQEYSKDSWDTQTGTATFITKRKGIPEMVRTFSLDDAKQAKLLDKPGPWQGYRPRMCFNRARAFALRDAYADVLKGLAIYEEVRDIIDTTAERTDVAPRLAGPRRASEIKAEPAAAPVPESATVADGRLPEEVNKEQSDGEDAGDGQIPHYRGKVVKVEKYKAATGTMFRIIMADANKYVTEVKEFADAAQSAIKGEADVEIDYAQGIGEREVLNLLVPEPVK